MTYVHTNPIKLTSLIGTALLAVLYASTATAQTVADDVVCTRCVDKSDIAPGAVTKGKIASGAVRKRHIAPGQVTTGKIADGAVTAAKLTADAVFGRIIVVRNDPADNVGNCNDLVDALAAITDNDANNRYLIRLEPGIYDCGDQAVFRMKPYVDIRGAGQELTLIRGTVEGSVVFGANDVALSMLRVENTGSNFPRAINTGSTTMRINHVTAVAQNAGSNSFGILAGGTALLAKVTAIADTAVFNAVGVGTNGGAPTMVNVTAIGTNDTGENRGAFVSSFDAQPVLTARNSVFAGSTAAILGDLDSTANIISTQLDGGATGSAVYRCAGAYDGNFAPLNSSCQ